MESKIKFNKSRLARIIGVFLIWKGAMVFFQGFPDLWIAFPKTPYQKESYQIVCFILFFALSEVIFGAGFLFSNPSLIYWSPLFAIAGLLVNFWGLYQISRIEFYIDPQIPILFMLMIFFYIYLIVFSIQQIQKIENV